MRVKLIPHKYAKALHFGLTIGREYEVLAIEYDYYRIMTDTESKPYGNDPALYKSACFDVVDPNAPPFWVTEDLEGERCSGPAIWMGYFFEDYHDGIEDIRNEFISHLRQYYPWTWNERFGR